MFKQFLKKLYHKFLKQSKSLKKEYSAKDKSSLEDIKWITVKDRKK